MLKTCNYKDKIKLRIQIKKLQLRKQNRPYNYLHNKCLLLKSTASNLKIFPQMEVVEVYIFHNFRETTKKIRTILVTNWDRLITPRLLNKNHQSLQFKKRLLDKASLTSLFVPPMDGPISKPSNYSCPSDIRKLQAY